MTAEEGDGVELSAPNGAQYIEECRLEMGRDDGKNKECWPDDLKLPARKRVPLG